MHDELLLGVLALISCTPEALGVSSHTSYSSRVNFSSCSLTDGVFKVFPLLQTMIACLLARKKCVGSRLEFMYRFNRADYVHILDMHIQYVRLIACMSLLGNAVFQGSMQTESKQRSCGELKLTGWDEDERSARHRQTV